MSPRRLVFAGAVLLVVGAALVDVGPPAAQRVGNGVMIVAGVGLAFLPRAVGGTGWGRGLYWAGLALASLVDLPAVVDPSDRRAGQALGVPAMLLLSAGLVVMWRRHRQPALLVAALWFVVQLPLNALLFIAPDGRPSFVLQVIGCAAALAVAAQRSRMATTPWPPAAQMEISPRP